MKLVGKKLYRIGHLKLYKQYDPAEEEKKRKAREFQEAMKKKQWLADQAKQDSAIEKKEWKD